MAASTSKTAKKWGKIDEDDVLSILHHYTVDTILVVLQEIANFPANEIDWSIVTKNTNSRVSNTRDLGPKELSEMEVKRLWRHMAYRRPLMNSGDGDGDGGDDGDSDLEFELESVDLGGVMKEVINVVQSLVSGEVVEPSVKKNKDKLVKK